MYRGLTKIPLCRGSEHTYAYFYLSRYLHLVDLKISRETKKWCWSTSGSGSRVKENNVNCAAGCYNEHTPYNDILQYCDPLPLGNYTVNFYNVTSFVWQAKQAYALYKVLLYLICSSWVAKPPKALLKTL